MIDFDSTPARYRGTIEVYEEDVPKGYVSVDGPWRWRCKSRNGQILADGKCYRRKAGALNAIDAMFGAKFWAAYDGADARYAVPWRLVIHDRHGNTTTGAVY